MYEQTAAPQESVEQAIQKYAYIVKQIAYHLISRLPSSVQIEDLMQAGMIGLIEAHQRYDATKSPSFEGYAGIRIRGTMIDELRKSSWMPRSVHQNMRKISQAIHQVENRMGREAKSQEIASELGVNAEEYAELLSDSHANELYSIDDMDENAMGVSESQDEPHTVVEMQEFKDHLSKLIEDLPHQEQIVLAFYYSEKLKFKEIGEVIGVGEARVCQLHSQALARIQARLKKDK